MKKPENDLLKKTRKKKEKRDDEALKITPLMLLRNIGPAITEESNFKVRLARLLQTMIPNLVKMKAMIHYCPKNTT